MKQRKESKLGRAVMPLMNIDIELNNMKQPEWIAHKYVHGFHYKLTDSQEKLNMIKEEKKNMIKEIRKYGQFENLKGFLFGIFVGLVALGFVALYHKAV